MARKTAPGSGSVPGQKRRLVEDHSAGLARSPKSVPCPPMEGAGEDSPVLCPETKSHKRGFGDSGAGPEGSGLAGVMAATEIASGAKWRLFGISKIPGASRAEAPLVCT